MNDVNGSHLVTIIVGINMHEMSHAQVEIRMSIRLAPIVEMSSWQDVKIIR